MTDLGRNVSQEIAYVALNDLCLAVTDRLHYKGLVETDNSHEVVAETGFEDVQQLL